MPIKQSKTELSNTLLALRLKAGLTPQELAKAIGAGTSYSEAYESGRIVPTPLMFARLTTAFRCADLVVRFPAIAPIPMKRMAQPENVPLRLQHLLNVVAEGNQRRFAIGVGLPEGTVSLLVNSKLPLSELKATQLLSVLPTLRREWLLRGQGEPFTALPVPTFAPVSKVAPKPVFGSAPVAEQWRELLVLQVLPLLDPAGPTNGRAPTPKKRLVDLAQTFRLLLAGRVRHESGPGPASA